MGDVTTSGVVTGLDSRGRYADVYHWYHLVLYHPDSSSHYALHSMHSMHSMQPCTMYCARYALCSRVPLVPLALYQPDSSRHYETLHCVPCTICTMPVPIRQYKADVPIRLNQTNMKQTPPIYASVHEDVCCMQRTNQIFISLAGQRYLSLFPF